MTINYFPTIHSICTATPLQLPQAFVKVSHGLDSAKIILQGDVFVGGVRVFVRQAESEQDAWNLERVMHLRDERNRPALADEHGALAEALLERIVRNLEKRVGVRSDPGFALAEDLELHFHGLRQQL